MEINIITPVFNEQKNINFFYYDFLKVFEKNKDIDFSIFFVDNCSTDGTRECIKKLIKKDKRINLIPHTRNFGYQASLISGLNASRADAYILIDVDGEDPPELTTQFISFYKKGYEIVYGERNKRKEMLLFVFLRKLFYRFTRLIADWEFVLDMAEFSIISDNVKKKILDNNSTFPFLRSDFAYVGYKRKKIEYNRKKRYSGKSNYNIKNMFTFAMTGILTASTFPLRFIVYLSLPLIILNLFFVIDKVKKLEFLNFEILLALNLSFFLVSFSFFAIYLSRIYKDIINRPKYVVDDNQKIINKEKK